MQPASHSTSVLRLALLLGTASFAVLANVMPARGADAPQTPPVATPPPAAPQLMLAQAQVEEPLPETVLITGSLIRGTAAVGVPVTQLRGIEFQETGALTTAELLRSVPALDVQTTVTPLAGGGRISYSQNVEIHGFSGSGGDAKSLLLINGHRWPIQGHGGDTLDPSIVPAIAVERIDIVTAGASAVYGSDAVAGVINVIMRRNFDGAISQVGVAGSPEIGGLNVRYSQLWGRTWDTGNVTFSGEVYHTQRVQATARREYYTTNFEPFGLYDPSPLGYSAPAVATIGNPSLPPATVVDGWPLPPAGISARNATRYCADCYPVPLGSGWDWGTQPEGPTTTWADMQALQWTPYQRNEANQRGPYEDSDLAPAQYRGAFAATAEQRLTPDLWGLGPVRLSGAAFWSNRRSVLAYPGTAASGNSAEHVSLRMPNGFPVAAINPYRPTGAPANIQMHYLFSAELGGARITGGEVAKRGEFALNFDDLPFGWIGDIFYSMTDDRNYAHTTKMINPNNAMAALGNIVPAQPATGDFEYLGSYTKPSDIPYLNVFCDPTQFKCNDQRTLDYITGFRNQDEYWKIRQVGANFSGPIFTLPGGTVQGAISFEHVAQDYQFIDRDNVRNHSTAIIQQAVDAFQRDSHAFFGQLNIPVFGEGFALPLFQRFELELGYRVDKYDFLPEYVKTPKIAANWDLGAGVRLRGAWGKSFRAPGFGQVSATSGSRVYGVNQLGGDPQNNFRLDCAAYRDQPGGAPSPGSVTELLNPTCNNTDPALFAPAGIEIAGGSGLAAPARGISLRPTPTKDLNPESANQYVLGFNYAPTGFLNGLVADVSYFNIKVEDTIQSDSSGDGNPNDPLARGQYLLIPNPNASIFDPSNAEFLAVITELQTFLRSEIRPEIVPGIKFIHDSANTNIGFVQLEGIDFDVRYDWDWGNLGSWNAGVSGYYEIDFKQQATPVAPVDSNYEGKDSGARLHRMRFRLGWTNGTWSMTGFANYQGHTGKSAGQNLPLPECYWHEDFGPGACYPGSPWYPQDGPIFDDSAPAHYEFDLNIAYNTGMTPTNTYLQNLTFSLTIQNLLDRKPPFQYASRSRAREIRAYDTRWSEFQRFLTLTVTKTW
jgi:iron complex outermembrane receptor protein